MEETDKTVSDSEIVSTGGKSKPSKKKLIVVICAVVAIAIVGVVLAIMPKSKAALLRKAEVVDLRSLIELEYDSKIEAMKMFEGKAVIITGYVSAAPDSHTVCLKWHLGNYDQASFPPDWDNRKCTLVDTYCSVDFVDRKGAFKVSKGEKITVVGILQDIGWRLVPGTIISEHGDTLTNACLLD